MVSREERKWKKSRCRRARQIDITRRRKAQISDVSAIERNIYSAAFHFFTTLLYHFASNPNREILKLESRCSRPIEPPPQVPRALHQLFVLVLLHLQLPLSLDGNEEHLDPFRARCSPDHALSRRSGVLLGALLLEVDSLALLHALAERLMRSARSVRGRLLLGEERLADGRVLRLQDLRWVAWCCACG